MPLRLLFRQHLLSLTQDPTLAPWDLLPLPRSINMAGVISNYYRALMLDYGISATVFTPPVVLWVSLYTQSPGAGDVGLEAVASGSVLNDGSISNYARVSQPNTLLSWGPTILGTKTNVANIAIPTQTGTMGVIQSVGWRDDQFAGNLLWCCDLNTPITLNKGGSILWVPGDFSIIWV